MLLVVVLLLDTIFFAPLLCARRYFKLHHHRAIQPTGGGGVCWCRTSIATQHVPTRKIINIIIIVFRGCRRANKVLRLYFVYMRYQTTAEAATRGRRMRGVKQHHKPDLCFFYNTHGIVCREERQQQQRTEGRVFISHQRVHEREDYMFSRPMREWKKHFRPRSLSLLLQLSASDLFS